MNRGRHCFKSIRNPAICTLCVFFISTSVLILLICIYCDADRSHASVRCWAHIGAPPATLTSKPTEGGKINHNAFTVPDFLYTEARGRSGASLVIASTLSSLSVAYRMPRAWRRMGIHADLSHGNAKAPNMPSLVIVSRQVMRCCTF